MVGIGQFPSLCNGTQREKIRVAFALSQLSFGWWHIEGRSLPLLSYYALLYVEGLRHGSVLAWASPASMMISRLAK